jgi:hypothetical protein
MGGHVKRYVWVVVLCIACFSAVAHGEVSVELYQKLRSKNELNQGWFIAYINGLGRGFGWMNTELASRGQPRVFCAPEKFGLRAENYIDVLDRQLERREGDSSTVIELVLLNGLKRTFPCP